MLLFANVEIPGPMNGFGLAQRAAKRWPSMAILVTSGRLLPGFGDVPEGSVFIPKPYRSKELLENARRVLEQKNPGVLQTVPLLF